MRKPLDYTAPIIQPVPSDTASARTLAGTLSSSCANACRAVLFAGRITIYKHPGTTSPSLSLIATEPLAVVIVAQNGTPDTVTIDKRGANHAALKTLNANRERPIKIRQQKYRNNIEPGT